ncbi:MAG: class I SAM-dependent methyltransferase [Planctomycetaceae bacterium]|nr:class I SAM-dependent methyltransferase [Planctomycetaceae bacterium]
MTNRDLSVTGTAVSVPDDPPRIVSWGAVEEFESPLAVMETVFWEPDDTLSLRKLIRETDLVRDQSVLEIGTGSGLVALCCLHAGARRVVATDINPNALVCAAYNAAELDLESHLELRRVSEEQPAAFAVIDSAERFDLIFSNPPWEDQQPQSVAEYALYDRNFALMKSLLDGLPQHLRPNGKALLAYGCRDAIVTLLRSAAERQFATKILDDRKLDDLPEVFLPGMLIEITLPEESTPSGPSSP